MNDNYNNARFREKAIIRPGGKTERENQDLLPEEADEWEKVQQEADREEKPFHDYPEQTPSQQTIDRDKLGMAEFEARESPENESSKPTRRVQTGSVDEQRKSKRIILISVAIDGSYSFTTVFPSVYYILKRVVENLESHRTKNEFHNISFQYGLTIIRNQEPSQMTDFTDKTEDFLDKVRSIEFYGGSEDGHEDVTVGIKAALSSMNKKAAEAEEGQRVDCGLIVFSDSIPKENMHPKLYGVELDDQHDYGLRFARIYAYSNDYHPVFRMVDKDGKHNPNERQDSVCCSLKELLSQDGTTDIEEIVNEIVQQTSV